MFKQLIVNDFLMLFAYLGCFAVMWTNFMEQLLLLSLKWVNILDLHDFIVTFHISIAKAVQPGSVTMTCVSKQRDFELWFSLSEIEEGICWNRMMSFWHSGGIRKISGPWLSAPSHRVTGSQTIFRSISTSSVRMLLSSFVGILKASHAFKAPR